MSMVFLPALLLAAQAAPVPGATEPSPAIVAPADWSQIPALPWRTAPRISPDLVTVVEQEMSADGCRLAPGPITVDMAVLVRGDGGLRAVVPRAIDCPTVEQFAAGLVTSFARNNLRPRAAGWYRTAITFDRR